MDPLQQAIQLLQEAQQTIAMQAEEIQALRQQIKKPEAGNMQKKASLEKIAAIAGVDQTNMPEFLKLADEQELTDFIASIRQQAKDTAIGKIAQIDDGTSHETPGDQLEDALSSIISR